MAFENGLRFVDRDVYEAQIDKALGPDSIIRLAQEPIPQEIRWRARPISNGVVKLHYEMPFLPVQLIEVEPDIMAVSGIIQLGNNMGRLNITMDRAGIIAPVPHFYEHGYLFAPELRQSANEPFKQHFIA